jgi:hypothetical protein
MMAADVPIAPVIPIGFFKKNKKAIIGLSIFLVCVVLGLAIVLALGLKDGGFLKDGSLDDEAVVPNPVYEKYEEYDMSPMGDINFTDLECEVCTSIVNLGLTPTGGEEKVFPIVDIRDTKIVVIEANLLITFILVKSLTRPIMFYGNAKDARIPNKSLLAFSDYYRYDRPFFLNFIEIETGYWKLQCDFLSTFIDADSTDILIQLCILGPTLQSVKARSIEVSPAIKSSLMKYRIFAKNSENVIVIDNNLLSVRNQWVAVVCPSEEICRTSCTICKTTVPDYRNRKNAEGVRIEEKFEDLALGKISYGPIALPINLPGQGLRIMGNMVLTSFVIESTSQPKIVEIVNNTLLILPITFVQNTDGMWEWDIDIMYNHLRREIYVQSADDPDEQTVYMTMYYIEDENLSFETQDFIRKGFIAQRNNTFLKGAEFTECLCI